MKKNLVLIFTMTFMIILLSGCALQNEKRYEASFLELFDTATTIVGYAKSEEEFTVYSQSIYDQLKEYDELYDIYNTYDGINNIKTINDNAGIEPVKVDKKIIDLLLFSKEMYELTDGKVNVAFGSVLSLWHEYRTEGLDDPENASLPDMQELEERAEHTNIDDVIIDEEASTVFLSDPEMSLDVGAIAKGFATEKISEEMEANGFYHAMISVGGNVRTFGPKFGETGEELPWGVGIQNPDLTSDQSSLYILNLTETSLVTSGVYERYYVVDGKQYHHIIDPDTLMPAEYYVSVSIICKDSGIADALSTAVFNMPYEEGEELIQSLDDVEALWVFSDGTEKKSAGFDSLVKDN